MIPQLPRYCISAAGSDAAAHSVFQRSPPELFLTAAGGLSTIRRQPLYWLGAGICSFFPVISFSPCLSVHEHPHIPAGIFGETLI